jgi:hypothetical protein
MNHFDKSKDSHYSTRDVPLNSLHSKDKSIKGIIGIPKSSLGHVDPNDLKIKLISGDAEIRANSALMTGGGSPSKLNLN